MMFAEADTVRTCNGTTKPCNYWVGTTAAGLPNDVSDVRAASTYVVTMGITTPKFSESWFTNNELSQITPMPVAWDHDGRGAPERHCATTSPMLRMPAVYDYLNAQAQKASTYATSPLWGVVDGPWKVKSLNPQGNLTLSFNSQLLAARSPRTTSPRSSSSRTRPSRLSTTCCRTRPPGQTIDVGYLPTVDAPVPPAGAQIGSNPRSSLPELRAQRAQYLVAAELLPVQLQQHHGPGRRSSISRTSARRSSRWSTRKA